MRKKPRGICNFCKKKTLLNKVHLCRSCALPLSSLKKKVWAVFARYIKGRDHWTCVTCGFKEKSVRLNAGHFLQGRAGKTLFDPRGVHAQCAGCNSNGGSPVEYYRFMRETYGEEVITELRNQDREVYQYSRPELIKLLEEYKYKTMTPTPQKKLTIPELLNEAPTIESESDWKLRFDDGFVPLVPGFSAMKDFLTMLVLLNNILWRG